MNPHMFQRIIWGLVLVTAGVFFLLDQTGLITIDLAYMFSTYWPVILIFFGLTGFAGQQRYHWGGAFWCFILCAVGTVFLLKNLNLMTISVKELFQYLWPVALILLGLGVIFKSGRRNSHDWQTIHDAKHQAREARHEARREQHRKHRNPWDNDNWSGTTPDRSSEKASEVKRDLSEEEKAVLKDIHGEFDVNKHRTDWDPTEPPAKMDSPRKPHYQRERKYDDFVRNVDSGEVMHRHGFIGDVRLGQEPWELKPLQISHFIGDSEIDLTRASIPLGETPINVTAFIGDVKIFIPNDIDVEVRVMASSFIGDMKVLDRRESGFLRNVRTQTSHYEEAERKLIVTTSMFIGDITIKRIG
ncbi:cell wall-active antibiotics response protein LiaF [Paenibacillus sedimenti]|uniref:Cell wall-active antibiotics response protein n=1 Tax=Paenibacillus sedimenti TaxID=2770274 RepID=A0A926QJ52_9BACL|nr:cell wall-active antibiotics response protein LiaF [Paenibacillus sedimenti]MBD0380139.1 cell wall-active antibiotics response protein [Paenibacillus sedimenti]